jgi:transcriptional regulator with XRE-family HTH domain
MQVTERASIVSIGKKRILQKGFGADAQASAVAIGVRLRHARLTKGLSLRAVADQVGCSESFVSKIENDKVNPSLATLHKLVRVLETNIAALFSDGPDESSVQIFRPGSRPLIRMDPLRHGKGIVLERLLSQARSTLLQANIHRIDPGGESDGRIEHEGEEIGYILKGELELRIDDKTYLLSAGDSFFFPSHLPHGYSNPGATETQVIWINTPPTF